MSEHPEDKPDETNLESQGEHRHPIAEDTHTPDPDSLAVAMDYYILQDSSYNNRFNIFVALQGALLVFASLDSPLLIDRSASVVANLSMDTLVRLFGLITSSIWLYTQLKQTIIITHMRKALPRFYPSLSHVVFKNAKRDAFPFSNYLFLNLVPVLFVSIWIFAVVESAGGISQSSAPEQPAAQTESSIADETHVSTR